MKLTQAEKNRYIAAIPAVADAAALRETLWQNEGLTAFAEAPAPVTDGQIAEAEARLQRFAPYIAEVFPETGSGIIESPLLRADRMQERLLALGEMTVPGQLYIKLDSHLPVTGSIKARGGIYEVLKHGETLAQEAGMLCPEDDYRVLTEPRFRDFFRQYTVQVGSTGNLGMSIGIMSAQLGFRVIVHMSSDAKQWKKDLLRSRGVEVREYRTDYCAAVAQGRMNSAADPMSYFVDDEKSMDLFLGYAVAGKRLKQQLDEKGVAVDDRHPLFVYLPCGIGGAPGGVAYGLKHVFGDAVHCFFAEPVKACCMLLGAATGMHDDVCVQDFGIDGRTEADGLRLW